MSIAKLIVTVLCLTCAWQTQASEILELQDYHASEAKVGKTGSWLGLQQAGKGWRLVAVKPSFRKIPDAISGEGVRVAANTSNVRILLSDPGLKAGLVSVSDEVKLVSGSIDEEFELSTLPSLGQERMLHRQVNADSLQTREGKSNHTTDKPQT